MASLLTHNVVIVQPKQFMLATCVLLTHTHL
jgi:hypothetical protein